ncbi:sulfur carrier protein ThiS [Thermosediminibacter litoriperuensis]|uniref:Thiazole synthase/sulfur carrier protein n=1 Tax=Thermosediminibacter litoriperuensis TaxID=291989 RepID=A0A5S5AV28_9FIRM|nr:sulfur carrier protein ThiS [Thermosediminibacter litoriperuensis]TYP56740.1 thiazole synthase/sulfur carrier protein [Thermosediminibacter litoriperuensis]
MIKVNKEDMDYVDGMTIQDILKIRKYSHTMITVIVNGQVVPKDSYPTYRVKDGDVINVIHMMSGGC